MPLRQRLEREPYWLAIGALFLGGGLLFIYHLLTGSTPGEVAFTIPLLNLPIYWYGVVIVSGIALGAYVVASLAEERALASLERHVPPHVQQIPVAALNLPLGMEETLRRRGVETLGRLLLLWGFNPRLLGLQQSALQELEARLLELPGVEAPWLVDAPWRRWNPDHVWNGLVLCLVLALVGARLYHVLTPSPSMAAVGIHSPLDYFRNPYRLVDFRSGGLGIYGGLAGGALGLFIYTRRQRIPLLAWSDLAVIGVALGQFAGRWGNFFNQELYGRPAAVPWAIYIDPEHRLPAYAAFDRFHPAFLYESLWNLFTFTVLYALLRRAQPQLRPGDLMGVYLIFYAAGRILLETVRLDSAAITIAGMDIDIAVATLVSLAVALLMAVWMAWRRRSAYRQ